MRGGVRVDHTEDNWTSHYLVIPKTRIELMLSEVLRLKEAEVQALKNQKTTSEEKAAEAKARAAVTKAKLEAENSLLKEKLARANQQLFGTSSEKSTEQPLAPEQTQSESVLQQQAAEPIAPPTKKPRTSNGGRKPLPADLPRERVEHSLSPEDQVCPCCKGEIHAIGEEVTEQLTYVPATYKVLRHARAKYVCRKCNEFITAPGVKQMVEKSSYGSPEFLAHIMASKFQYSLPFYRLEGILEQDGLSIDRTTLGSLAIGCADKAVALTELFRQKLLEQRALHMDETTVQVLKETNRRPQSKSYLWLYRSTADAFYQIVLYEYQMTRSGEHPRRFLNIGEADAYTGYIHVDGYAGYNGLDGTVRVGCMTHVRRKFKDVVKLLPSGTVGSLAQVAVELLGKLYDIERRIKGLDHHYRHKVRQEESVPILREFKIWLDKTYLTVAPKSALGKAISYARDQWSAVSRYVEDGALAIDNNISEREIKLVVIGRKNWMFADSMDGMRANATMYSLVATARANGLNPYDYLRHVFATLPYLKTAAEVESLLPWNLPQLRRTH